jgi:hypothetical protein
MGASVAGLTLVCGNEQLMHPLAADSKHLRNLRIGHALVSHFHHTI